MQFTHWLSLDITIVWSDGLCVPPGHGIGVLDPSTQKDPGVQSSHSVWPAVGWNLPATQLVQTSAFGDGLIVPGAHGVGSAEPTEQLVPTGQSTHCSTLVITESDASLCLPPGHGSAAAAPSEQ